MLARFAAAALAFLLSPSPAPAQVAVVVASCPTTRATPYPAGTQVLLTVDVNGNLCSTATSSGGGSAVTVADGADVAQGTTTDSACGTDNGTCTAIALLKRIAQRITTAYTSVVLQAGSAVVGKVGIDQTTPGTTNGVQVNAALPAGTNSIGAVVIGVGATPTDRTVTSSTGSSQTVMSANAARRSLTIVNTGNANCGVNPTGGTAAIGGAGTLTLAPLGSYTPRLPTVAAVTAICTAGQPLYADET